MPRPTTTDAKPKRGATRPLDVRLAEALDQRERVDRKILGLRLLLVAERLKAVPASAREGRAIGPLVHAGYHDQVMPFVHSGWLASKLPLEELDAIMGWDTGPDPESDPKTGR